MSKKNSTFVPKTNTKALKIKEACLYKSPRRVYHISSNEDI